jgi:serine/threonine protein kinase
MFQTWQELEGKVIDEKFLLVRCLGGSEGSAVFLAEGIGEGTPTAVKLIAIDPQEPEAQLSRLRAAEKLSHPNLIRVLDAGRCETGSGAFFYLRMEYAEENLGQLLPQRTLTVEEACQLIPPLVEVLGYLHGQGFVHGHVKPSNILAIGDQLKLSSNGLHAAGEPARLDPQSIYTAPEAASEGMTAAADSWSLGITLLEALTGRPPVWENGQDDPAIPGTLPAPFLDVVRHCLRRDPRQRWTVEEVDARLRQESPRPQENSGVPAQKNATAEQSAPVQQSGNRRELVLASLAALVVAALLAGFVLRGDRSASEQASPSAQQATQAPAQERNEQERQPVAPKPAQTPAQEQPSPREAVRSAVPLGLKQAVPDNAAQDSVTHREMPNVSQKALSTIHGTVRVRIKVEVGPSGSVEQASFVSRGPSSYFAERSMQAAKLWQFRPRESSGQNVASEWLLRFQYRNSGTTVIPERAGR